MIKNVQDIHAAEMPKEEEKPYQEIVQPVRGQRLARNCALTALLLLTVVSVRNEQLPSGQTVFQAVQALSGEGWDESLGKISFVSALVPDTVAVFGGGQETQYALSSPAMSGVMTHAWSKDEPYLSYRSGDGKVYAMGNGQVMSVTGSADNGYSLRVRQSDGLETLYYDLAAVSVREGDPIEAQACIGQCLNERETVVEVRRDGIALDPTPWMQVP